MPLPAHTSPASRRAASRKPAGPTSRATRIAALVDRLAEPRSFRLRVALVLAAISLLSAYVSHVASERDATVADLDALASQQWAEEQQVEQQLDAMVAQDQRLTARLDEQWHTYVKSVAEATAVRVKEPDRAAELDLDAQSSYAQVTQFLPFLRASSPDLTGEIAVYDTDAALANVRFADPRLFRASSELTKGQARRAADTARSTILVVVILVAALFLLTLAHVAGGRRGLALAAAGTATAIGGIAFFTALEISTALPLLVGAVMVVIALVVVRIPRVRAALEGIDRGSVVGELAAVPTRPGTTAITNPNDPPASRFNRYIAIAIAVATLLGAGVGYLHGRASSSSEDQAWKARDLGVEAIGALRADEEGLTVALETYQQALAKHIDAWNAAQRASYAAWSGDTLGAKRMTLEAERLEELALRYEARSGVADDLGSTGVSSEAVLRGLRADVWKSSATLAALQDAANSASRTWGGRAGMYLAVLAWLAVAAYLLGLSLIFRDRRVRLVLASVGTVLILAAVVRSGTAWAEPGPVTDSQAAAAADAYAAGTVAQIRMDPAGAEKHFAEAIRLRPDFGIASRDRVQAIFETGSAPGLGIRAAFTDDAVNQAIEELGAARANRADTADVILNLGAMLFHRSIQTGSMADMEQSLAYTRMGLGLGLGEAYESKHGSPHLNQFIGEMNLGLALLGTGDAKQAEQVYRTVGRRIGKLPRYLRPYVVSAALTPLGLLGKAANPPSEKTINAMKELVVTEGYGVGAESPAQVTSVRVELFASLLQWRANITDLDPARDKLSVQWYRFDPAVDSWSSLPIMSGQLTFGAVDTAGSFYTDVATGRDAYWGNTGAALTDVPPACVRPGRYRVELYLNGQLQGTAEGDSVAEQYKPLLARDVGVAMCRPADWSVTGTPGLSTTAVSADRSRGVAIFRIHEPRAPSGQDSRAIALDRVVEGRLTGLPKNLGSGSKLNPATEPTVLGTNNSVWRLFKYPGGIAKVSATESVWGTVTVVCLYGPEAWVTSPKAKQLILSIIRH